MASAETRRHTLVEMNERLRADRLVLNQITVQRGEVKLFLRTPPGDVRRRDERFHLFVAAQKERLSYEPLEQRCLQVKTRATVVTVDSRGRPAPPVVHGDKEEMMDLIKFNQLLDRLQPQVYMVDVVNPKLRNYVVHLKHTVPGRCCFQIRLAVTGWRFPARANAKADRVVTVIESRRPLLPNEADRRRQRDTDALSLVAADTRAGGRHRKEAGERACAEVASTGLAALPSVVPDAVRAECRSLARRVAELESQVTPRSAVPGGERARTKAAGKGKAKTRGKPAKTRENGRDRAGTEGRRTPSSSVASEDHSRPSPADASSKTAALANIGAMPQPLVGRAETAQERTFPSPGSLARQESGLHGSGRHSVGRSDKSQATSSASNAASSARRRDTTPHKSHPRRSRHHRRRPTASPASSVSPSSGDDEEATGRSSALRRHRQEGHRDDTEGGSSFLRHDAVPIPACDRWPMDDGGFDAMLAARDELVLSDGAFSGYAEGTFGDDGAALSAASRSSSSSSSSSESSGSDSESGSESDDDAVGF